MSRIPYLISDSSIATTCSNSDIYSRNYSHHIRLLHLSGRSILAIDPLLAQTTCCRSPCLSQRAKTPSPVPKGHHLYELMSVKECPSVFASLLDLRAIVEIILVHTLTKPSPSSPNTRTNATNSPALVPNPQRKKHAKAVPRQLSRMTMEMGYRSER
jgi:hypothetical protein